MTNDTTPTNAELVAEARRLDAAASPGPWTRHDTGTQLGVMAGVPPEFRLYLTRSDTAKRICTANKSEENSVNLDFVAAARTLLPELAARLEAAERENAALRAALKDVLRLSKSPMQDAAILITDGMESPVHSEDTYAACRERIAIRERAAALLAPKEPKS